MSKFTLCFEVSEETKRKLEVMLAWNSRLTADQFMEKLINAEFDYSLRALAQDMGIQYTR